MEKAIQDYLEQMKIGRKQSHKNLALYPLLSNYSIDMDFLLLDEALNQNFIEILEKDADGSVPELRVMNKSSEMILILDGEELVGAKQNRIVNITILIKGKTSIVIPGSCVEHGRWHYDSPTFHSEERIMPSNLRAMKSQQVTFSRRSFGKYNSDQGAIWDGIAEKAGRMEANSPRGAMAAIYEKERPSLEEYVNSFHLIDSQIGAVFMINGKVAGLDTFGKPETFKQVFKKLLQSYSLDAIDWFDSEKEHKASKSEVTRFQKAVMVAESEGGPSAGLGTDYRLESRKVTGFALAFDGQVMHVSIFKRTDEEKGHRVESRMRRFAERRRNRR